MVLPKAIVRSARDLMRILSQRRNTQEKWQTKIFRYCQMVDLSHEDEQTAIARLRAYAHSLDKGLHMTDWAPGHSKSVYHEALSIAEDLESSDPTYVWASKVLREYEYRQIGQVRTKTPLGQDVVHSPITSQNFMRFLQFRRSNRQYTNKPVALEHVEMIVAAALEAPSSSNRQTLKVYATVDPDIAIKIGQNFHGFTGFSPYVPAMFVFTVDLRPYKFPAELFVPILDTGLGVENAALMAFSLGLSMTQLIWVGDQESDLNLRSYFDIPFYEDIVVGAACGFPEYGTVKPIRKSVDDTLKMK